jgi:hypothetical protein
MEDRIKECQLDLYADRTSTAMASSCPAAATWGRPAVRLTGAASARLTDLPRAAAPVTIAASSQGPPRPRIRPEMSQSLSRRTTPRGNLPEEKQTNLAQNLLDQPKIM